MARGTGLEPGYIPPLYRIIFFIDDCRKDWRAWRYESAMRRRATRERQRGVDNH